MNVRWRKMPAVGGLAAIAVAISLSTVKSVDGKPSVGTSLHTTIVRRGKVQATVSAIGKLAPVAALAVNFAAGGVLTEVDVKAGDKVKAGQMLAKVDDTQTMAAVVSAQAALASAHDDLANAQQQATLLVATQNAMASAQQQVAAAQSRLNAAVQGAAINATGYEYSIGQLRAQLDRDLDQYSNDEATCSAAATPEAEAGSGSSCAAALAQDQYAISTENDALMTATQQATSGQLADEQSIDEARRAWLAARNILATTLAADNAKPANTSIRVADVQARFNQAQGELDAAEKSEAGTILTAPGDATVASVNGVVGQTVSGGGTSPISDSGSGSTDSGSSSASSGSPAFLTLDNELALQVVVGFAVPDAKRIQFGQSATIALSALHDQPVSGQVTTMDVNSGNGGDLIMRHVAVTIGDPPAAIKPGMTAIVSVVVNVHDNVLKVPTADITTTGGTFSVVLVHNRRQIVVEVTTGLADDQFTEITSGLSEGESIVDSAPHRQLARPMQNA